MKDNEISGRKAGLVGAPPDVATRKRLGRTCAEETEEFLRARVTHLFAQIDDVLFERAKTQAGSELEAVYFDAIQSLRRYREMITEAFLGIVEESVVEFWSRVTSHSSPFHAKAPEGGLSLMQEDDLEENIAVTNIVSKAEKEFQASLAALNKRFGVLAGPAQFSNGMNPVGPQSITQAFQESLTLWSGELPVRLIVYKLFDEHLMIRLGDLYARLNDELIAASVLPGLSEEDALDVKPAKTTYQRVAGSPPGVTLDSDPGLKISDEVSIFGLVTVLRSLLAPQRESLGLMSVPGAEESALPKIKPDELVDSLLQMQGRYATTTAADLESAHEFSTQFRENFARLLSGGEQDARKQLPTPDQHIVDVVMMLFDFVLDDPLMPDAMKVVLSRLQIPVLRAAVSDRSFLSNKNHPTRSLLNNLARTGIRWADDGDRSAQSLYGRVEAAVNRVLTEYSDDVSVFASIDREFQAEIVKETNGARVAEERAAQVARGQEQLTLARERVSELLSSSMNEQMPVAAYNLLNEGWRDVLTLVLLREGENSAAWKKAVSVVERLVDSVIPRTEQWQRQKIMRGIPMLIADLREGFASVSYDAKKSAVLFKQLQLCHINALRGQSGRTIAEEFQDQVPGFHEQPEEEWLQDQYHEMALAVETGQWLTWQDAEGASLRGKISWKSEITDLLLFVDSRGKKVAEMTTRDLAELFRGGRVRALDDIGAPLLDRALTSVMAMLRNPAGGGKSVMPA